LLGAFNTQLSIAIEKPIRVKVMMLKLTEVFCTVLCWFGPLAFVLLLGATDLLGHKKDGSWCWITDRSDRGWWIQLLCFYLPLWLMVRHYLILYTNKHKKEESNRRGESPEARRKEGKVTQRKEVETQGKKEEGGKE